MNDPFRVFKHYDDYSKDMVVIPNRDFVSTEVYKQNKESQKYDSFIFGSSRTIAFRTYTWQKYLGENASPYVFDASAETIFGMNRKVKYLAEKNDTIKNAILLICRNATFTNDGDNNGHLLKKHPEVAKTSWFRFYIEFLKSYFEVKFLASYYVYKFTGKYHSWMNGYIEPREIKYDPIRNDVTIVDQDEALREDEEKFYRDRAELFYDRKKTGHTSSAIINEKQEKMLQEIMDVFEKHHTCFSVVVSPLYEQIPLHEKDLGILKNIFGPDKVYDYSGVNKFTNDLHNYYEASHYRPKVGEAIMEEIYQSNCRQLTHENTPDNTNL